MVGLHGGDDGIDGTPLERMHGRCPSHGALTRPGLRRREAAITPGRCRCARRGRARSTSLRGGLAARSFGDAAQAFTRWSTGLEFSAAMPHGGGPCTSSPRAPTSAPFASCSGKRPAGKWRIRSLPSPEQPQSFGAPAVSASCDGPVPSVGSGEAFARSISSMPAAMPSIC